MLRQLRQIHALREEAAGGDPEVMDRFMIFLQSWLVGHIIGVDKRYGAWACRPSRWPCTDYRTCGADL